MNTSEWSTTGQLIANISHELRTPLSAILGFSALMKNPDLARQDREEYAQIIEKNGDILVRLIDDLLDVSKLEAGKIRFDHQPVHLSALLSEVTKVIKFKASEKGLSFLLETDAGLPDWILTDPVRVRQIILNLLGNAVKFSERGAVVLSVEKQTLEAGIFLNFIVEDRGPGISSEQQKTLFVPFSQGDISSRRKFGGTGLGLYLSKQLADKLGGDLKLVWSEPHVGSQFSLSIPLSESRPPDKQEASFAPLNSLRGLRILVADDARDNQVLMTRYLEKTGALIDTAYHGEMAVEMSERNHYDAILMDIQMPVMDGLEATRLLRKKNYKGLILAVTADAVREQIQRAVAAGCDGHVAKPIQFENLIRLISRGVKMMNPHEVLEHA